MAGVVVVAMAVVVVIRWRWRVVLVDGRVALCCWAVSVDDLALVGARIGNTETR